MAHARGMWASEGGHVPVLWPILGVCACQDAACALPCPVLPCALPCMSCGLPCPGLCSALPIACLILSMWLLVPHAR